MNVNDNIGSLLQKKHMGSFFAANTWTPKHMDCKTHGLRKRINELQEFRGLNICGIKSAN